MRRAERSCGGQRNSPRNLARQCPSMIFTPPITLTVQFSAYMASHFIDLPTPRTPIDSHMSTRNRYTRGRSALRAFLETPLDDLDGWQRLVRLVCDVPVHALARMTRNHAFQMSAALAYQTIFGLVPVMVIAMVLFRAFGGTGVLLGSAASDQAPAQVGLIQKLLDTLGLSKIAIGTEGETISTSIIQMVKTIDQSVNFTSVSIIGIFVFAWAAIGLLTTIERSFNIVCKAHSNRSLARRFPLYWMAMTVGPAIIYASYYLQNKVVHYIQQHATIPGIEAGLSALARLSSFALIWIFLMGLYVLMPNARVRAWAAAVGALVAALLWGLATEGLSAYIRATFTAGSSWSILYGSLGLIPIFLLWINVIWLVVLFGLEMTISLQSPARHRTGLLELRPYANSRSSILDPTFSIPVMAVVRDRFEGGASAHASEVADSVRLPQVQVEMLLEAFASVGLLHRLDRIGGATYSLAMPPERIKIDQLLAAAQSLTAAPAGGADVKGPWQWVARLREAQMTLAGKTTLAEMA